MQDLDMALIPRNLDNILLGGMTIVKLAEIKCVNLSFLNCTFCPEFLLNYPRALKVEKLLFFGGPTRVMNSEELSAIIEHKTSGLLWIAFDRFDTNVDDKIEYDHVTKLKTRVPIESDGERERLQTIMTWLRSRSGFPYDETSQYLNFILQRDSAKDEWNCLMSMKIVGKEIGGVTKGIATNYGQSALIPVISGRSKFATNF